MEKMKAMAILFFGTVLLLGGLFIRYLTNPNSIYRNLGLILNFLGGILIIIITLYSSRKFAR